MKPTHYVYHHLDLKKAILHHGSCGSCNDGDGINPNTTGERSEWLGFPNREAAQAFVDGKKAEGYGDTGVCGNCAGEYVEPEIKNRLTSQMKGRMIRKTTR